MLRVAAVALILGPVAACSGGTVYAVREGACIESLADFAGDVGDLPTVECTEPHEYEVLHLHLYEGRDEDYPGVHALAVEARRVCEGEAFEAYTGVADEDTTIAVELVAPSEETWRDGDRTTLCLGTVGEPVTVSFDGNGATFPSE